VFIELTDQLRCPADHDESFLVLIPDVMAGREVVEGLLGCPVCQREFPIRNGIVDFGTGTGDTAAAGRSPAPIDAAALLAFLGLEGPGGYVGLVGDASRFAGELVPLLPGVHLALVNPPAAQPGLPGVSLLRAPRLPFKQRSLRGLVLGAPEALALSWSEAAVRAVLPGLRAVGQGASPDFPGFELLGSAEGWWVGRAGKK